jgi:hypothetical protein
MAIAARDLHVGIAQMAGITYPITAGRLSVYHLPVFHLSAKFPD